MEKRQKLIDARLARRLEQADVAESLVVTPATVSRWERGVCTPYKVHIDALCDFFGKSREALDLPTPDQPEQHEQPAQEDPVASEHATPEVDLLMETRRQALHNIVNVATALLISPYELLPKESRERLLMAKIHPSYLDDGAIDDLSVITERHWKLMKSDIAPLDMLIGAISEHFSMIIQFLKDAHPTPIYNKLCALASENAQLLGSIFHQIREYDLSYAYYKFALKVALDVGHTDLWAVGVGRMGLLQLYWGNPRDGLPLLAEAQRLTIHDQRVKAKLSAIEAEVYAELGKNDACLRALERVKRVTLPDHLEDDIYSTEFNPSLATGFEGACYVRLRQPELALPILTHGLTLTSASPGHQGSQITDIGAVYAQLDDPKKACELLGQVLSIIKQTRSMVSLQRVYKARAELAPWKNSVEVRELDDQLRDTVKALKQRTAVS